jgi:hypothetical protein
MLMRVAVSCWLALGFGGALAADAQQPVAAITGLSPSLPTTADQVSIEIQIFLACTGVLHPTVEGSTIHVVLNQSLILCPGPPLPSSGLPVAVPVGPLPAGNYTVSLENPPLQVDSRVLAVTAPATELALLDRWWQGVAHRFSVGVTWSYPDGRPGGAAQALKVTDNAGAFWFFDSSNLEVTVKLLDGGVVNGQFWLFAASMTTLPFTMTVVDHLGTHGECYTAPAPAACTRTYHSRSGANQNFIDLSAFPSP